MLGWAIHKKDNGWVGAGSCACKSECDVVFSEQQQKRILGWFIFPSSSLHACRLEDVWLLRLAVPCVTAFKKKGKEKKETLAKKNFFFTGFGCQMQGIMDGTAGEKDGEMRLARQVSRTAQTWAQKHKGLHALWAGNPVVQKEKVNNSSSSHCTPTTHKQRPRDGLGLHVAVGAVQISICESVHF